MSGILGRATAATAEDPFADGDPLEVARLVRRALADARRRATEVTDVLLVAEAEPDPGRLARFVRRALGPSGGAVGATAWAAGPGDHVARCAMAVSRLVGARAQGDGTPVTGAPPDGRRGGPVGIAVVLGPGAAATALCVHLPG
ncbi:MAG: hypothetical protein U0869_10090 [Chloroflexota bacterium]